MDQTFCHPLMLILVEILEILRLSQPTDVKDKSDLSDQATFFKSSLFQF